MGRAGEVTLIAWCPTASGSVRKVESVHSSRAEATRTARALYAGLRTKVVGGESKATDTRPKWLARTAREVYYE